MNFTFHFVKFLRSRFEEGEKIGEILAAKKVLGQLIVSFIGYFFYTPQDGSSVELPKSKEKKKFGKVCFHEEKNTTNRTGTNKKEQDGFVF